MKIPIELLNKWKAIRSHGDNARIAEQFPGVLSINVSRAFDGRDIKDEVFIAIRDFYAAKEARLYPPAVKMDPINGPTGHGPDICASDADSGL